MHWHKSARRSLFLLHWALGVCGLTVVTGSGCGLSFKEGGGAAETIKKPELLCARAGADRVEASSFRGDGKNDIFKVFVRSPEAGGGVVLSCKELDLNGDGRKDMLVYYDVRGHKQREEFDHDFDGLADMKSFYEGGVLARQELDIDFDDKTDLMKYIENGKRVRLEKIAAAPPAAAPTKTDASSTTTPSPLANPFSSEAASGSAAPSSGGANPTPGSSSEAAPTNSPPPASSPVAPVRSN